MALVTLTSSREFYLRLCILGITILAFLSFVPDLLLYDGVLAANTPIDPHESMRYVFVFLLGLRIITGVTLGERFARIYAFGIVPGMLIIAIVLGVLSEVLFPNIVFGVTRMQPYVYGTIALYATFFSPVFVTRSLLRQYWRHTIAFIGIIAFSLFVFLKWRSPESFFWLDLEDSPLEYATAILYLAASIISVRSALVVRKATARFPKRLWHVLLVGSALFFFVIAGEEISWGQRLFGFATPDALLASNQQEELNLHNTSFVLPLVYDGYYALGLYGTLSWLLPYLLRRRITGALQPILSRWYLVPYFILMYAFIYIRFVLIYDPIDVWEETVELFLVVGIVLLYYLSYKDFRRSLV